MISSQTEEAPIIGEYAGFSATLNIHPETGHAQFMPIPPADLLDQFYNGGYIPRDSNAIRHEFNADVIDVARDLAAQACGLYGVPDDFRAHDIGCGSGRLVWAFQQLGHKASGNEASRDAVTAGNEFCGGALSAAPLKDALAALPAKVDLFTCFHVLEHLADPLAVLRTATKFLSPLGALCLEVPNSQCFQTAMHGPKGDPTFYFPAHLHYFSPTSLLEMLEEAGLKVISLSTHRIAHIENGHAIGEWLGKTEDTIAPAAWQAALDANFLGYALRIVAVASGNPLAPADDFHAMCGRANRIFAGFRERAARERRMAAEVAELTEQLAAARLAADAARRDAEAVRGSTSFRITAPMRAVVKAVRREA